MASWRIVRVTHESSDHEKREVNKFWAGLYPWMTESRLSEPWGDEKYGFAAAFDGDTCIATTSYTVSPRGQGILSQVHTVEEYRGQGVADATMNEAFAAYRDHGARAVYLAAWAEWIRDMYRRRGFELVGEMGGRGAFKRIMSDGGEDENLFRPGQSAELRPMAEYDQCDITSLFCAKHPVIIKNYELGCYLGSYFEGEFYILRNQKVEGVVPEERKDKKGFRAMVLDGEETILGLGTVIPSSRRHEGHTGILDVLVHPAYSDHAGKMIEALQENCELDQLRAYIEKDENGKRDLLVRAGFTKAADLPRHLDIAGETFDLEMWRKYY